MRGGCRGVSTPSALMPALVGEGRQPARVTRNVFVLPHTQSKSGDWGNILRSDDGPASGSRSVIAGETQSGFASAWFEKQSPGSDPSESNAARISSGFT